MSISLVSLTTQFLTVAIFILKTFVRHEIETQHNQLNGVYDYIVVGSGSAGSVVANRLAENGMARVLLLEAGGPSGLNNDIPSLASVSLLYNSQYDWNYTITNEWVGRAYAFQPETRGFVIGGSSSTNTMIYNRGNRRTYDTWAQAFGAKGWSYAEVMPYFLKSEKNLDPLIVNQSPGYHSTTGPVQISSVSHGDPLMAVHQYTINHELGIQTTDINGPNQLGTAITQAFIDGRGVRSSASNSYIDPNPYPHNLHILTGSLVTRILFEGRKANGVEFTLNKAKFHVLAKKEVIVSGGVINSPQLLMLSGIGPKKHLEQMGIPVLADLPVGDNLQDHPGLDINFLLNLKALKLVNIGGQLLIDQLYQWFTTGLGPLSQTYFSVTYFNTLINKDKLWPNAAFETILLLFPQTLKEFMTNHPFKDILSWNEYYRSFFGQYYINVHPLLQRLRSRGSVRLASTNPQKPPIIQTRFLTDPQDLEDYVELVSKTFQFYELSSFAQYLVPHKPIPGCKACPNKRYFYECDSYIRCLIQQTVYTTYHPVGTCRMGASERKDVVVDPHCRVKGVSNLRVCDSSIIPLIPNGNTNAASIMIGEKCADLIKSGH